MTKTAEPADAPTDAYAQVKALADRAAQLSAGSPVDREVRELVERLEGPLRVAIAGRVKAGKSTLLNALVGERLAPTNAGESTRLVSVYHQALGYDVNALLRDGRSHPLRFTRNDGVLRVELDGLELSAVDRLDVGWPSSALREVTLIDTPGLASLTEENSVRTQEFLALDEGRSMQADAVIYLMRHVHRSDAEFLDAFLDRSVGHVSPVNAVGVLSRADEIGACRLDAMQSAARIAERYRHDEELRALCATVVPLAGLLAETGLTLREQEAAALRSLAALEHDQLDRMLLSADRFSEPSSAALDAETRRDLLTRLGMFGLRLVLTEMRAGRTSTAQDVSELLVRSSGLHELRAVLTDHFLPRAQILKARAGLGALRNLARRLATTDPATGHRIEADTERVEASAHEFAELRLAHLVMSGAVTLSEDERVEVQRLTNRGAPAARAGLTAEAPTDAIRRASVAGVERWRARGADPLADRLVAEASEIVVRSYEELYLAAQASD